MPVSYVCTGGRDDVARKASKKTSTLRTARSAIADTLRDLGALSDELTAMSLRWEYIAAELSGAGEVAADQAQADA